MLVVDPVLGHLMVLECGFIAWDISIPSHVFIYAYIPHP
jgi:hypothetical protein